MTYGDNPERREFFRLNYNQPLQYRASGQKTPSNGAAARNISQTGILFKTETRPPEISSLLWLSVDYRTLKICQEIEGKALIFNNGLIGKVVRVEEDPESESFDVGVCFLKKDEAKSRDVQKLLAELESSQKAS